MRNREVRWLYTEIPTWVRSGILSEEGAERLRTLYGNRKEQDQERCPDYLRNTGSVLVGSGIILLFAHNWSGYLRTLQH